GFNLFKRIRNVTFPCKDASSEGSNVSRNQGTMAFDGEEHALASQVNGSATTDTLHFPVGTSEGLSSRRMRRRGSSSRYLEHLSPGADLPKFRRSSSLGEPAQFLDHGLSGGSSRNVVLSIPPSQTYPTADRRYGDLRLGTEEPTPTAMGDSHRGPARSGLSRHRPRARGRPNLKRRRRTGSPHSHAGIQTITKPPPLSVLNVLSLLSPTDSGPLDVYGYLPIQNLLAIHDRDQHSAVLRTVGRSVRAPSNAQSEGKAFSEALDRCSFYSWTPLVLGTHELNVPIVVAACVEELYRDGLSEPHLFRNIPHPLRLNRLVDVFNSSKSNFGLDTSLAEEPVANICSLLSTWLMSLPEPIVPPMISDALWAWCVSHSQSAFEINDERQSTHGVERSTKQPGSPDQAHVIEIAQLVLQLMPVPNLSLLVYLMAFFAQLAAAQKRVAYRTLSFPSGENMTDDKIEGKMETMGLLSVDAIAEMFGDWLFGRTDDATAGHRDRAQSSKKILLWFLIHWDGISDGLLEVGWSLSQSLPDNEAPRDEARTSKAEEVKSRSSQEASFDLQHLKDLDDTLKASKISAWIDTTVLNPPRDIQLRLSKSSGTWSMSSAAGSSPELLLERIPPTSSTTPPANVCTGRTKRQGKAFAAVEFHLNEGPQRMTPTPTTSLVRVGTSESDTASQAKVEFGDDAGISAHAEAVVSIMRNLVDGVKDLQVEIAKAEETPGLPGTGGFEQARSEVIMAGLSDLAKTLQDIPEPGDQVSLATSVIVGEVTEPEINPIPPVMSSRGSTARPLPPPPLPHVAMTPAASYASSATTLDPRVRLMNISTSTVDSGVDVEYDNHRHSLGDQVINALKPPSLDSLQNRNLPPNLADVKGENVTSLCDEIYGDMLEHGLLSFPASIAIPNPSALSKSNNPTLAKVTPLSPKPAPHTRPLPEPPLNFTLPQDVQEQAPRAKLVAGLTQEPPSHPLLQTSGALSRPPSLSLELERELSDLKAQKAQAFDALKEANEKIALLEKRLKEGEPGVGPRQRN
ncbi:hypothetical protein BKA70DRAFT_1527859, partial [Coprinopsis sp. MPI-PUGE-AT-0042]